MKKVKVGNRIGITTSIIPHRDGLYPIWFNDSDEVEFVESDLVKFIDEIYSFNAEKSLK